MSVNKISPVYNYNGKTNGQTLDATEWNSLSQATHDTVVKVNEVIDNLGNGGGTVIDSSGKISVSNKGNLTIGNNSIKNINLEPGYPYSQDNTKYGDIALKPGDDIQFVSHHREAKKRDKIVLKSIDGSDNPVKTQIVTGELEIALGTEDNPKTATRQKDSTTGADISETPLFKTEDSKTLDIRIITGQILDKNTNNKRDERANLKVRAKAIDLRCERHGGIALQPKGYDDEGNMNKIKFEHGGGDGLEFGTFNTEKTSIFTNEYRFNKDGVWKMSTREKEASGKTITDECDISLETLGKTATGAYKYKKNNSANNSEKALADGKTYEPADDFYDFIDTTDAQCTTKDIIKTAAAMNGNPQIHTHITNNGNLEIESEDYYTIDFGSQSTEETPQEYWQISEEFEEDRRYSEEELIDILGQGSEDLFVSADWDTITIWRSLVGSSSYEDCNIVRHHAPKINIESDSNIQIQAKGKLKLGGILDFGSNFNFGETDEGIEIQYKLTKKNSTKDCGIIKVSATNNHQSNNLTVDGWDDQNNSIKTCTITPGNTQVIAQCSLLDVILLTNYMKSNQQGPWAAQL